MMGLYRFLVASIVRCYQKNVSLTYVLSGRCKVEIIFAASVRCYHIFSDSLKY